MLAKSLPSVALQSLSFGALSRMVHTADYVCKGLPLILLDSRPLPPAGYPSTVEEALAHLQAVDKKLEVTEPDLVSYNMYWCSTIAFLHRVLDKYRSRAQRKDSHQTTKNRWLWQVRWEPTRTFSFGILFSCLILWQVLQEMQTSDDMLTEVDGGDIEMGELVPLMGANADLDLSAEESDIDLIGKLITGMNNLDNKMVTRRLERERKKLDALFKEVNDAPNADTLRKLLDVKSQSWVYEGGKDGYDNRAYQLFHAHPEHFVMKDKFKKSQLWLRSLYLKDDADFNAAKKATLLKIKEWRQSPTVYNHTIDKGTPKEVRWPQGIYMAAFDMLKAQDTYSANLDDRSCHIMCIILVRYIT